MCDLSTEQRRVMKQPCDKVAFKTHCISHIKLINATKRAYFSKKIDNCGTDHKKLFGILNTLLGNRSIHIPSFASGQVLADNFNTFFIEKIRKIKENLDLQHQTLHPRYRP